MSGVPLTDRRRTQALRAELARMAPWLTPQWAGLGQEGDFGAALYEIAARLAEHSTRRLDQTALRDKLAFLDTLDIAAPAPQPATVPIVFVLAEKRGDPVYAPARVQIAAAGADGEPVTFETREAIAISPARPLRLVVADPGADRIELAPPKVIAAPQPSPPPVTYRLVSAAEPRGTMLQLAQAVGLAAGDLIRIAGRVYRIAKRSGEIVTLLDPLEAPAPAGAAVEKVTRLDSFALRNLSEHLVYVGHKELLKLDGYATIVLRLDPPGLARRLAQLDIVYHLWGKRKDADAADWQELRLLGGRDGELRLRKDWEGAVEEVEAAGRKSRWIRLRLKTPIADAAPPDTRAASVELKVNSNAPAGPPADGSSSIVSAFYNGLPLPLTTAFLPFGPEPQRFDSFAIAAPEALSKKGAKVTLEVGLSDASLVAMTLADGTADRVYGIGRNGRLQAIRFDGTGAPAWRQLDRPVPPPDAAEGGTAPALDGKGPLLAIHSPADSANDLVLAGDKAKQLWLAQVAVEGTDRAARKWGRVEQLREEPPASLCLAAQAAAPDAAPQPPLIVGCDSKETYTRAVDVPTATLAAPQKLVDDPAGAIPRYPLVLGRVTGAANLVVAVDAEGGLFRGSLGPGTISWKQLLEAGNLDAKGPVAASQDEDGTLRIVAAAAGQADAPNTTLLVSLGTSGAPASVRAALAPSAVASLPESADGGPFSLTAAVGPEGILIFADKVQAHKVPLPVGAGSGSLCALLRPGAGDRLPSLLVGAPNELLLRAPIESTIHQFQMDWFDALWLEGDAKDALYVQRGTVAPQRLPSTRIEFGTRKALPLPSPGVAAAGSLTLLVPRTTAAQTGTRVAGDAGHLVLDALDTLTVQGDVIEIGGRLIEVVGISAEGEPEDAAAAAAADGAEAADGVVGAEDAEDADGAAGAEDAEDTEDAGSAEGAEGAEDEVRRRIAALARALPRNIRSYRTLRKAPFIIPGEDLRTLVRLSGALFPDEITGIRFGGSAAPSRQPFRKGSGGSPGETWLRFGSAWTVAPATASLSLQSLAGISQWSQTRLPRSTENPDLSWEYFDGRGWRRLDDGFRDGTANLASSGTISFLVPDDLAPTDVAGKQDYWIRARLDGGDYGRSSYVVETDIVETGGSRQSIRIDRSALNPPEIVTIEASYELQTYAAPQFVLTVNNLAPVDQTQAAAAAGAEFRLFEGLAAHTGDAAGLGRAIYLCLSRAPGVDALSLYVDAADVDAAPLRLQAEVLRPGGWAPIVCEDRTAGLTRPGLLQLFLATVPAQLPLFGCDGWWLRLRPLEPTNAWAPIVRGLYLNAITAEQAKSLRQEILGSSLGEPDQSYLLAEPPVLPGTLELRVRESLSDEEKTALTSADPAAVASYPDVAGEWIRWRATDSFVDQGGAARVFRLDPSTGQVRFGNGRDGKIPPAGRDAIRAVGYQTGGGSRGNVPAFAVDQLKTALESVELAVNPVDAGGGADAPPKERLAETAPARLRHATRALTRPDIEALATGSSPDVVRARCLPGRGCGIDLVVAIRKTGERCPVPSRARREGIARNIAAAGWGALAVEAIRVRPPRYVHISVEAVVVARDADAVARIENDVRNAIVAFLHPMDGGPRGLGWPFGRRPWPSDVQRVAAAVAGVDRVVDVAIAARDARGDLDRLGEDALVCAEEADISLVVQPPRSAP